MGQNKLDLVRVNYFKKYTYHHQLIMEQSQTSSPEPKTPKIEHENSEEIVQNIIQDVVHQIVPSHQLDGMAEEQQEEDQQTKESTEPVILAEEATVAKVAVLSK